MRGIYCFLMLVLLTAAAAMAEDGGSQYLGARFFETRAGTRFYLFQSDALWRDGRMSVWRHATAECLTPPTALEFEFPAMETEAGVMAMDIETTLRQSDDEKTVRSLSDFAGIAFWVKGDGSDAVGRVEIRNDYPVRGSSFEFALADTKWHRVFVNWPEFSPPADPKSAQAVCFGLTEGSARPASYIIDALRYAKTADEAPEMVKLAQAANARKEDIAIPARPSPASCVYNKGALAKARAKLRSGGNLKWLAYGDSVTVPVQLWNIPEEMHRAHYAYYAGAARTLEKEFGCKIEIVVNAVGGRQLNEDFQGLPASLQKEKPDVLVLLSGDTIGNYRTLMPQVLEAAKAAGTEVLVVIPTYDWMPLRSAAVDWLRRFCIENNVACADARSYLLGVPEEYWGDIIANPNHPNAVGHRLIGQVVAEMFG